MYGVSIKTNGYIDTVQHCDEASYFGIFCGYVVFG